MDVLPSPSLLLGPRGAAEIRRPNRGRPAAGGAPLQGNEFRSLWLQERCPPAQTRFSRLFPSRALLGVVALQSGPSCRQLKPSIAPSHPALVLCVDSLRSPGRAASAIQASGRTLKGASARARPARGPRAWQGEGSAPQDAMRRTPAAAPRPRALRKMGIECSINGLRGAVGGGGRPWAPCTTAWPRCFVLCWRADTRHWRAAFRAPLRLCAAPSDMYSLNH